MASFSSGVPGWICFISGLEVPIIAASTTTQAGGLASAQITMPYSPFLPKLPKHTKITLFSLDLSKDTEPYLELDGTIQDIQWRQDKVNGNTGLFVMAQTDGVVWSEREKYNFYIDNGFGLEPLLATQSEVESTNTISSSPVTDPLAYLLSNSGNDAGAASMLMLTHQFIKVNSKFDGSLNYKDCGYTFTRKNNTLDQSSDINPEYYTPYINKFYKIFQVTRKLCRLPVPAKWKKAFQEEYNWLILTHNIQPLEGKVNFWNYITYICEMFNFEVYDIPDAVITTLSSSDISHVNGVGGTNGQSILSEYIIKPKTPFGPIPYCNVVFPDQVLDKSFLKNYQNEITRCYSVITTFPGQATQQTEGLTKSGYSAPYIPDASNYFGSFNIKSPGFSVSDENKKFLTASAYEYEFGVNSKQVQLPEMLARLLTSTTSSDNVATLQNMINMEFFIQYTNKVSFTLQVTPDVNVVPGMSMLILDENDDHILVYCFGREKIWDKNGQSMINLKLMYPRPYYLENGFAANYLNTLDPSYYSDSFTEDLSILKKYIGCECLDQSTSIIDHITSIMTAWNLVDKNTPSLTNSSLYTRSRTTYSQYLAFYGVTGKKYDPNNAYNKMPETLIRNWDISDTAAVMPALQYSYAANGYQNRQTTNPSSPFKPNYADLNTPGDIKVSTYICGIVNCHNRYLMQVGNNIS